MSSLHVYVLKSDQCEVHISPTGCIIQKLLVPDRHGMLADIVLGFEEKQPYTDGTSPYFGCIVGRMANRIANATFQLDGRQYQLHANNGKASLHGGMVGFDKKEWAVVEPPSPEKQQLILQYVSDNGEEGYPGQLTARVRYMLDGATLSTDITATVAGQATIVNLAQHSYFNLAGHDKGSILNHTIQINSQHITAVDDDLIPTGRLTAVEGTAWDFRTPQTIGNRIKEVPGAAPGGYDHNYVLFGLGEQAAAKTKLGSVFAEPQLAVRLSESGSGRVMEVLTTAPGLQFYSGNFLDGSITGKDGAVYEQHAGLALETQLFPDAPNQPTFPSAVLRPGEQYQHKLVYRFTTD